MQDLPPHILIIATGGTIAGQSTTCAKNPHKKPTKHTNCQNQYRAGVLHIDKILDSLRLLDSTYPALKARISTKQLFNIDSADMNDKIWLTLIKEIKKAISTNATKTATTKSTKIDGIVITHGTDTLEESAYFLHLAMSAFSTKSTQKSTPQSSAQKSPIPIVLTGAMRPFDALDFDGAQNLYNAISLACEKSAKSVMVVMNEKIFCPRDLSKLHTNDIDAFGMSNEKNLGIIKKGKITFATFHSKAFSSKTKSSPHPLKWLKIADLLRKKHLPKVDILYSYSNDASAIAAKAFVKNGSQGLVIAGSGAGSIHKNHKKTLKNLIKKGIAIVVSSRINRGSIALKDSDKNAGFIDSNGLNPQKARVLLALALIYTNDINKIQECFDRC
ncbi:asparaginase [Helicobacter sp. T3_23-1059]